MNTFLSKNLSLDHAKGMVYLMLKLWSILLPLFLTTSFFIEAFYIRIGMDVYEEAKMFVNANIYLTEILSYFSMGATLFLLSRAPNILHTNAKLSRVKQGPLQKSLEVCSFLYLLLALGVFSLITVFTIFPPHTFLWAIQLLITLGVPLVVATRAISLLKAEEA